MAGNSEKKEHAFRVFSRDLKTMIFRRFFFTGQRTFDSLGGGLAQKQICPARRGKPSTM